MEENENPTAQPANRVEENENPTAQPANRVEEMRDIRCFYRSNGYLNTDVNNERTPLCNFTVSEYKIPCFEQY